ncbi:MAG: hypothetical protein VKK42_16635 [Lyngbya sp.]|nr:hypothetical protein [Lyngbya sp.]
MNNRELERILTKIEVLTFNLPKEWRENFKPILAECQQDLTARILIERHNNKDSEFLIRCSEPTKSRMEKAPGGI